MAEAKLPDYNAMPHLPPAELIAKETEQRFSGWASVGATPSHSDYTALERKCQELEREVERLRKIEAAANGMINAGLVDISAAEDAYTALAAALGDGRKG